MCYEIKKANTHHSIKASRRTSKYTKGIGKGSRASRFSKIIFYNFIRWKFFTFISSQRAFCWFVSMYSCSGGTFFSVKHLPLGLTVKSITGSTGLARKKKAGAWSPLAFFYPRRVVSYRWSKNNILASLCLASYLAVNWLQKLETKHCAYYAEVILEVLCVCVRACVRACAVWYGMVSQFDLSITN